MIKDVLIAAFRMLPRSIGLRVRDRYWQVKSRLIYGTLYKMLGLECTLRSGLTLQVASKGEWWVFNDIFVNGEYDVPILQSLQDCPPRDSLTVLDLGANVGYFTLRVVDLMRQKSMTCRLNVTMVEGSATVFDSLETRMRSHNMPEVSMQMVQGLVGLRTGSAGLRESAVHVKNTIMTEKNRNDRMTEFVDLTPLIEGIQNIDLLKCDIEGAELLFLETYENLLGKVRSAVFEFHHDMCDTNRCRDILNRNGFQETVLRSTPTFSVIFMTKASWS